MDLWPWRYQPCVAKVFARLVPRTLIHCIFLNIKKAALAAFFMVTSLLHAFGILFFGWAWLAYDHYRPWVNFHSETLALLGVGLMLASRCLGVAGSSAKAPRAVFFVIALALIPWMQYLLRISFFAGDALVTSLFLGSLSAAIWLGYSYTVDERDSTKVLTPIFYTLWLVALVSAAIGLLQWLSLTEIFTVYLVQADDENNRAMGNLGQPNQLATLMLMGMACLVWTFERRRIGQAGLFAGIGFMTIALVLSQSRAGMLSALVVAIFLVYKNKADTYRLPTKHVLIWLLMFAVAVFALPYIHEVLLLSNSRGGVRFTDGARSIMWRQMLAGIAESPWIGYGWNQTPTAHAAGSIAVPGSLTFSYAHNAVLDLLAWNGVPLGALLTAAIAWWFAKRIKMAKDSNAVYAMAVLLPVAIHSMVEFPFAYSYFLLAAGLMVGVVEGSLPDQKTKRLDLRWVGAALGIWFVLGTYMVYEYFLIEEDFRVVRFENLRVGKTPADYEVPHIWMLSHMGSMLNAGRQQPTPGMNEQDIENLRKTSLRFPYGALAVRYALALGLNGDPEGATREMAVIRGMYGAFYYQAAVDVLRERQQQYPELAKVLTP
ncbi:MAG: Wzy polymerase domain-containing protein [Polaromonas sp.]|uniref:PglL family O-oligosaccharyltransferase n=1 Tax=Polaromonas sp. TaxID=1869339 RepID=UPI0032660E0B